MLGINDPGIYLGYFFSVLGLIVCLVYGIRYWNQGMEKEVSELEKDLDWEEKDNQIKSEI